VLQDPAVSFNTVSLSSRDVFKVHASMLQELPLQAAGAPVATAKLRTLAGRHETGMSA
jgi:hypothetical protein